MRLCTFIFMALIMPISNAHSDETSKSFDFTKTSFDINEEDDSGQSTIERFIEDGLYQVENDKDSTIPFWDIENNLAPLSKSLKKKILKSHSLPDNHPIREALDKIFSTRILSSLEAMRKAGFIDPREKSKGLVIGWHPKLKGYVLKAYLDKNPVDELRQWTKRIKGAQLVRESLKRFNYGSIMKVPHKWIYKIPSSAKAKKAYNYAKEYVLIAEDMEIVDNETNRLLYRTAMTVPLLRALYDLFVDCQLIDSAFIFNIPFAHDGKIAFVDTEYAGATPHSWNFLSRLNKYLSIEMQLEWKKIIRSKI